MRPQHLPLSISKRGSLNFGVKNVKWRISRFSFLIKFFLFFYYLKSHAFVHAKETSHFLSSFVKSNLGGHSILGSESLGDGILTGKLQLEAGGFRQL